MELEKRMQTEGFKRKRLTNTDPNYCWDNEIEAKRVREGFIPRNMKEIMSFPTFREFADQVPFPLKNFLEMGDFDGFCRYVENHHSLDLNQTDPTNNWGYAIIHYVVEQGFIRVLGYLLRIGPARIPKLDVRQRIKSDIGLEPLQLAIKNNEWEGIQSKDEECETEPNSYKHPPVGGHHWFCNKEKY